MKTQRGAAMVEFAIIALLFFMILFGIIEFGRAFFTYNTLVEATRRGARIAAVCPVSTAGILQVQQATVFDNSPDGSTSPTSGLLGLSTNDVAVSYFDENMNEITSPIASITDEAYDNIRFVRVEIESLNGNNDIQLIIPGTSIAFPVPPIVTTLPSESLGRVSSENPITQRCCYGVCTT
jgi:Flp pilus assembly protein TadG